MNIKFGISDILQAFNPEAVGSKVLDKEKFLKVLTQALEKHDFSKNQQAGQSFVQLPDEACELVSCGVGRRTKDPADYVVREWRGEIQPYLKRDHAAKTTGVAVIVYDRRAYELDPEVDKERFLAACGDEDVTHVVVAVLAFGGPKGKPPVGPNRFCHNLGGSNNEYNVAQRLDVHMEALSRQPFKSDKGGEYPGMHRDSKRGLEEQVNFLLSEFKRLSSAAAESVEYWATWSVVAD